MWVLGAAAASLAPGGVPAANLPPRLPCITPPMRADAECDCRGVKGACPPPPAVGLATWCPYYAAAAEGPPRLYRWHEAPAVLRYNPFIRRCAGVGWGLQHCAWQHPSAHRLRVPAGDPQTLLLPLALTVALLTPSTPRPLPAPPTTTPGAAATARACLHASAAPPSCTCTTRAATSGATWRPRC